MYIARRRSKFVQQNFGVCMLCSELHELTSKSAGGEPGIT